MHTLYRLAWISLLLLAACVPGAPGPALPTGGATEPAQGAGAPSSMPVSTPMSTPGVETALTAFHRSGQTFLTWSERADLRGEVYRVYRAAAPITAVNLAQASFLAQVGKDSARVWGNYYQDNDIYAPRLAERFIFNRGARPLEPGTGALVWTLAPEDFGGGARGAGYYAVTITPNGGQEIFSAEYTTPALEEAVGFPEPVEITYTPGIYPGEGGHFYLQYMDLRRWNATFHAPNNTNEYYGFDPDQIDAANALAYVYDYSVFEPTPELCGGDVPDALPVLVFLHGWRNNRYPTPRDYPYPYCAYGVYPVDQTQTWYFGFARYHDFRTDIPIQPGDVIENYTEQRVLRMVADLMRYPPGPAVDPRRVYLAGHSMGGTGTLAMAQRYPNVFAAAYSGQPVTDFQAGPGIDANWTGDVAMKWGDPALNLPIAIDAPNQWADPLQKYNGTGVFDWQNLRSAFDPQASPSRGADDMVPFGIDHGTIDEAVLFPTQGQPIYPLLAGSPRAWAGAVTETAHEWSFFGWPLPGLGKQQDAPFWNFQVVLNETVPGLSRLSGNLPGPPDAPTTYNQTILWSSSWNDWDGPPLDQPNRWRMSFCAVEAGAQKCGGRQTQTVDITPRRLQRFKARPGQAYRWEARPVEGGLFNWRGAAGGTVRADAGGLITIPHVKVPPGGIRLDIRPVR